MSKFRNTCFVFAMVAVFAVVGCGGGGSSKKMEVTPMPTPEPEPMPVDNLAMERENIKMKLAIAQTAVNEVDNESTDDEVDAADAAIEDAKMAIKNAMNIPDGEKEANNTTVVTLASVLETAKENRMVAMNEAQRVADAAMMKKAMKLHMGIGEMPLGGTGEATRTGAYNSDEDMIEVTIGTKTAVSLMEDKDMMIAANRGWMGKKYAASPDDEGMYEARVYSNVGEPMQGEKFDEEYTLDEDSGETATLDTSADGVSGKVDSPSFDHTAGKKEFEKGENLERVVIAGSYHGVSGKYYCAPTSGEMCSATVAVEGFTLAGGTWTFKPTNPDARVMGASDMAYASYGWWIHKSEDGEYTVSAFVDEKGTVADASGIGTLRGTATYMGGAAGKYSLYSATDGTNDAGQFTARATLEADFNEDKIMGTIDNFMNADGESRNWSVELKKSSVSDTGTIEEMETIWTIDETPGSSGGQWSGALKDNGKDSVPNVVTGTFHSTFGAGGRMVGAFGANKQE